MSQNNSSGDGINTGTGGFPINTGAGPDKAYVLDTAAEANDAPPAWNSGDIAVDNSIRDVSPTTKRTLASYLSKTTLGQTPSSPSAAPNRYTVNNSPSQDPVDLKLQDAEGWSVPLTQIDPAVQPSFSPRFSTGRSNDSAALSLNRGRLNPTPGSPDGNSLLADAAVPSSSPPLWPNTGVPNFTSLSQGSPTRSYYDRVISNNSFITRFDIADATQKYLDKLASYVNSGVPPMNKGNAYPVAVSTREITKLTDAEGYPATLTTLSGVSGNFFRGLGTGRSLLSSNLKILRGRQRPTSDTREDGNSLLPFSTDVLVGSQVPPPAGTVNVTTLSNTSPVKTYTEASISENEYSYSQPYSTPARLRPEDSIDSTPVGEQTRRDISSQSRTRLLDYLSTSTKKGDSRNFYTIDKESSRTDETLRDVNGNATLPHNVDNTDRFVEHTLLTSRGAEVNKLQRGKTTSPGSTVNGNDLLKTATILPKVINNPVSERGVFTPMGRSPISSEPIISYYSGSVFVNRYSPDSQYLSVSGDNNAPLFSKDYVAGQSLPSDSPKRDVTFGRLAQIGNALSRRATAELGSTTSENPSDSSAVASDILPGTSQLGVKKIDVSDLTAQSVIDDLTTSGVSDNLLINPTEKSWGTLNNVNDEFSGISAFGMQLLAAALTVGVCLIIGLFSLFFNWRGGGPEPVTPSEDGNYRPPFGAYRFDPAAGIDYNNPLSITKGAITGKLNFWRLFGIASTTYNLSDCIAVGCLSYFGIISPDTGVAGMQAVAALQGAVSVTSSPGYYAIMARNISRSYLVISDAFLSLGKSFQAGAVATFAKQLIGLIEVFRSSKFFRILNIFSQLGDRIKLSYRADPNNANQELSDGVDKDSSGPGMRHLTKIDVADVKAYGKSRFTTIRGSNTKHVWSAATSPDALLAPGDYFGVSLLAREESKSSRHYSHEFLSDVRQSEGGTAGSLISSDTGRISTIQREGLEAYLDSEYVPFYFHDVRTNEIVSFHAFLSSLSDDYSVSYDTVDAIGRAEPLKIYKSTTRKIGLSFYVAALHEDDLQSMYAKINKLTTMIYPQFNEGRQLVTDDYTITVPFSQTFQAAPFIRLRVGDLIRSNYSRFNLARIFGYDNKNSVFGRKKSSDVKSNDAIEKRTIKDGLIEENKSKPGSKFKVTPEFSSANYYNNSVRSDNFPPLKDLESPPANLYFQIRGALAGDEVWGVIKRIDKSKDLGKGYEDKEIKIKKDRLIYLMFPTPDELDKQVLTKISAAQSQKLSDYFEQVESFISDEDLSTVGATGNILEGNAVAKSFRSSGGKGLAGHIDSMNFDWYDKVTWDVTRGRQAPKMCKITISFTPSQDITPGLDHNGINRAPIYVVR